MRAFLIVLLGLWVGVSQAAEPVSQFSADQDMSVAGKTISSKLYVDSGNMRMDMNIPGAPAMSSIVNGEKKVVWMLLPGNMYMEHAVSADDDLSRQAWAGGAENRELLGTEKINGQVCDKYRIKGADQDVFFYADPKTGFPVMMVAPAQSVRIEWKNVKPGPQSASLFQLPAGVQKMALPQFPGGFKLPGMK